MPWAVERPNAGFMLVDDDEIVGAHLAFYSERTIDGRRERFCNLGAWCVLPEPPLPRPAAAQGAAGPGRLPLHRPVPERQRRRAQQAARLPLPRHHDRARAEPAVADAAGPGRDQLGPGVIERTLTGRDLQLYRDHARTRGARHLVLIRGGEYCYVIFRKDRRKGLPLFATILHVSNPELFRALARPARAPPAAPPRRAGDAGRASASSATARGSSLAIRSPRRKMFRSPTSSRPRSTTSTASWSACRGETRTEQGDTPSMHTQLHHIVADMAAAAADAPALTFKDTTLSYAELWDDVARLRRRPRPGSASQRGERVGDLPRQADRDRRLDLRHLGRRRRLRPGQPAAAGQAGRLHPRRLRRARARDHAPSASSCCATSCADARRSST